MAVIPTLAESPFSFEQPTADAEQRKRRARIAEALLLQGSSGEPIQHWTQGLNRVAQGLVGGYIGGDIERQAQAEKLAQAQAVAREAGITFPGPDKPAAQPGFFQRLFGGGQQAAAPQAGTPEAPPQYPPGNPVTPQYMQRVAQIESGGDPRNVTGSYKGTYQLSEPEFRKAGGTGSIFDPQANAQAAATKFGGETDWFRQKYGRDPTPGEQYLIHQQGQGGIAAHLANPDQPAWVSMASTAEGQQKGPAWAKQAIWGNVPDNMKKLYGSVDRITSRDFMDLWSRKVQGGPTLTQPSPTPYPQTLPPTPRQALDIPADKQAAILDHLRVGNLKRAQEIIKQYEKPIDETKDLTTPQERVAAGVSPDYKGPVQRERGGKLLFPEKPLVDIKNMGQAEFEKHYETELSKRAIGTLESGDKAVGDIQRIGLLRNLLGEIKTGKITPATATMGAWMQSVGMDPKTFGIDPRTPATVEAATALINKSALSNIGTAEGGIPANNFSEADRDFIIKLEANVRNRPEANDIILTAKERISQLALQKADAWAEARANKISYEKFESDWRRQVQKSNVFGDLAEKVRTLSPEAAGSKPIEWERDPRTGQPRIKQ